MVNRRRRSLLSYLIFLACLLAGGVPIVSHAQVITNIKPDLTLGTTITPSGNIFNISGGRIKGTNQFHSFSQFSVGTGDIASFNGLPVIQNILARVTGGTRSEIDGTLRSTISGANLFLLNPSGILFGPNAQLDVSGSFHATTADYIRLADGASFNAVPSSADNLLTTAPPSAFGFLPSNPAPAPIDVLRGGLDFSLGQVNVLNVPDGKTLSLVGGPINLGAAERRDANGQIIQDARPAYLVAPGGRINLVSVASSGEAAIDSSGAINVDNFARLGDISIKGGNVVVDGFELLSDSIVDAKEIFVRGGRLVMNDAALFPGFFLGSPNGGAIDIKVASDINLRATGIDQVIMAMPGGIRTGPAPAGPGEPGDVPDIRVQADSVSLSGPVRIQSDRFGPGTAADVVITANTVEVRDGASMSVNNLFAGPGGSLTINAQEVLLSGDNNPGFTGLAAQSFFSLFYSGIPLDPAGPSVPLDPALTFADGGTLTVNAAKSLTVRGGAEITTDSFAFGRAGDIFINAGDMSLSRDGASKGAIASQSILAGNSGNITINATGQITMTSGFRVSATTGGSGDGGAGTVTAAKGINISGDATGIFSVTTTPPESALDSFAALFNVGEEQANYAMLRQMATDTLGIPDPSLFDVLRMLRDVFGVIAVDDLTVGNAGKVSISTPQLTMSAGALVDSSTGWDGNAGAVQGQVGSLIVSGGAEIRSRSGFAVPDPENPGSTLLFVGTGNAGEVTISAADAVSLSDGSVSTTTLGNGNAGNISLSANQVNVQNGGSLTSASGQMVNGQLIVGTGNAGQIAVSAPTLAMADGGTISVATSGAGSAGSILLNGNTLSLTGGSQVVSSTTGSGQGGSVAATAGESIFISGSGSGLLSTASSTGNAGQITVSAPSLMPVPTFTMANGGKISVATSGAGSAGSILLNANTLSLTGGAQVVSSTTNIGNAGSISLNVSEFTQTGGGSRVESSTSGAGAGGTLELTASELVSISGAGSGLFSTASGTGNAGQITVAAPGSTPVPTLTIGDNGKISVVTSLKESGAGSAGSIFVNANNFSLTGGAQVESSTSGFGQGGSVTATATQSMSISGSGSLPSGLFSTASSTGNAGQITVSAPALAPVPTLTMADGGTISVATSGAGSAGSILLNANTLSLTGGAQVVSSTTNIGNAGSISLNVSEFTQTGGGSRVESSTSGAGAGGTLELTASELVSISGAGAGYSARRRAREMPGRSR